MEQESSFNAQTQLLCTTKLWEGLIFPIKRLMFMISTENPRNGGRKFSIKQKCLLQSMPTFSTKQNQKKNFVTKVFGELGGAACSDRA